MVSKAFKSAQWQTFELFYTKGVEIMSLAMLTVVCIPF